MGDDIGSGLLSMAVCFDFLSTNIVQLSNRNPYFYRFPCHHSLITQLRINLIISSNPNNISLFRPFPTFFFYIFSGNAMVWLFWLLTLNSLVNPWIYLAFNSELRAPLKNLFRDKLCRNSSSWV